MKKTVKRYQAGGIVPGRSVIKAATAKNKKPSPTSNITSKTPAFPNKPSAQPSVRPKKQEGGSKAGRPKSTGTAEMTVDGKDYGVKYKETSKTGPKRSVEKVKFKGDKSVGNPIKGGKDKTVYTDGTVKTRKSQTKYKELTPAEIKLGERFKKEDEATMKKGGATKRKTIKKK